ncbi:MAG: folate-binding protein [Zoogloeaceae bacterium]|jgi:folate-binding protein YgfZ|nr:folate-binding protein [Zoogloeaceae bacterium]
MNHTTAPLEQEIRLAATDTIFTPQLHLASLEISGADARAFLHNQFTNDVKSLQTAQAQLSAWCTAKGRVVANFILYPLASDEAGDTFRLLLSPELLPNFIKRLQMYVLRSRVKLTRLSGAFGHLGLSGANSTDALTAIGLPAPKTPLSVATQGETSIIRLPDGRFILTAPEESLYAFQQQLSAQTRIQPTSQTAWAWLDIQAALPWITAATTEAFVPQMMDFEKMSGVSFTKGCYPGQEIVARSQYLGQVKRHLYRVASEHPLTAGEELHSPASSGQAAGKVVTAAAAIDPTGAYAALAVVLDAAAADLRQGSVDGAIVRVTPVYQS